MTLGSQLKCVGFIRTMRETWQVYFYNNAHQAPNTLSLTQTVQSSKVLSIMITLRTTSNGSGIKKQIHKPKLVPLYTRARVILGSASPSPGILYLVYYVTGNYLAN